MTVDPSWLIVYKGDIKLNRYVEMLQENGMLVADPRLQAIADAWKRYRYLQARSLNAEVQDARWKVDDLLDALTKEES